jgi:hypothetical protein
MLRIHAISDQDAAGRWLRDTYGDRLFMIVSPSSPMGAEHYRYATWPGISADRFAHGSEDGRAGGGFHGADPRLISRRWLLRNIRSRGAYGRQYPLHLFIMEGDTPSFLSLIPNGLNRPERPDHGGWGGRYEHRLPQPLQGLQPEPYPIWTTASDTVRGTDGTLHTSPQATIWRWREAVQNDLAARMRWTTTDGFDRANHPPVVALDHSETLTVPSGGTVRLNAAASYDPDGDDLQFRWFTYPEAGTYTGPVTISDPHARTTQVALGGITTPASVHVIVEVTDSGTPPLTRYARVVLEIAPD